MKIARMDQQGEVRREPNYRERCGGSATPCRADPSPAAPEWEATGSYPVQESDNQLRVR
jgi:hypothetical protein